MKRKFKVGEVYHHKFTRDDGKAGGGQLYVIVGINKHFLFLSMDAMYKPKDPGQVQVISIDEARQNEWPHTNN